MFSEHFAPDSSDSWLAPAGVFVRDEPEADEDEDDNGEDDNDEDDNGEEDDNEDDDDGYSE